MSGDLRNHIGRRASHAGLPVDHVLAGKLANYVELLARWNTTVNLTALELTPPTDEAIDRLLIEPLVAAFRLEPDDQILVDVGSGGGSPAIPMKIAAPRLRLTLVESRLKKAAFLREVVRHLELPEVQVENGRLEALAARVELRGQSDVVTLRAVTPTPELWGSIERLVRTGGRVFWFGGQPAVATPPAMAAAFRQPSTKIVPTPPRSQLSIVTL